MADQELRDQERMLNQEEQGRILDRDAQREQRRLYRMEVIQEIAEFERERDRNTNRIRGICTQSLTKFNFGRIEEIYITLIDFNSRLNHMINDWEEMFDSDESAKPHLSRKKNA